MSTLENPAETPSLHIQSLLHQQGPVSTYFAKLDNDDYLFHFYANPTEATINWLTEMIEKRGGIQFRHLPPVYIHGRLEEGGFAWSVKLGSALSMRDIWDNEPHNPLRSIRLVMQAVDAVATIQSEGGLHGDIRAYNLRVQWDEFSGEKLCLTGAQLGLWKGVERWEESDLSKDSAECMPPEVAAGYLPTVASDVYSLGVLLFRAVHGIVPFHKGSPWEMSASHATLPLERPVLSPPIHDDLWEIIVDCLHKEPSERISVQDLQVRLQPFALYENPIFLNLEFTDPDSIAAPTPPSPTLEPKSLVGDSQWKPISPRTMQELAFRPARPVGNQNSVDEEEEEVTQEHTVKVATKPPVNDLTQEVSASVEQTLDLRNPIQVMVGAQPLMSHQNPVATEPIETTSNIPVISWLEDSSERVIEVPVEYFATASHSALTNPNRSMSTSASTQENTGNIESARRRITAHIPQQIQFAVFMTLTSVITVLLLKIVEKVL